MSFVCVNTWWAFHHTEHFILQAQELLHIDFSGFSLWMKYCRACCCTTCWLSLISYGDLALDQVLKGRPKRGKSLEASRLLYECENLGDLMRVTLVSGNFLWTQPALCSNINISDQIPLPSELAFKASQNATWGLLFPPFNHHTRNSKFPFQPKGQEVTFHYLLLSALELLNVPISSDIPGSQEPFVTSSQPNCNTPG